MAVCQNTNADNILRSTCNSYGDCDFKSIGTIYLDFMQFKR